MAAAAQPSVDPPASWVQAGASFAEFFRSTFISPIPDHSNLWSKSFREEFGDGGNPWQQQAATNPQRQR
jgi:hypothetical protein